MSVVSESKNSTYSRLASAELDEVRESIRNNHYAGHTAGLCEGLLQCNLVVLSKDCATEFQKYCEANAIFCPLLSQSKAGQFRFDTLGSGIDLRTDLPLYNIYEDGQLNRTVRDITTLWRDDFVAFAIGCSFTFERALLEAGIRMRHIEKNLTVPMYKTNISTIPKGPFCGPAVVSMRPIKFSDLQKTKEICARYPHAHGVPIHVGDPSEIGIADISRPDWGESVLLEQDELPVFWGCGVTSQAAIITAELNLCITHAPGAMLITEINELSNSDWRVAGPLEEKIY